MQTPTITVEFSAGRSVAFTARNGRVQVIAQGFISPREMADAKRQAIQKLADGAGAPIQDGGTTWTPRRDPSGRAYQTRLIRRPDEKEVPRSIIDR